MRYEKYFASKDVGFQSNIEIGSLNLAVTREPMNELVEAPELISIHLETII